MSVVVEASVPVAAVVDSGRAGNWALGVLSGGEPVTPHLAPVEAANILRRLERAGKITADERGAAMTDLMALDLILLAFEPFWSRVWELRRNVTAYDAWYVAAAEAFGFPLATLDRSLSRASGVACRFELP